MSAVIVEPVDAGWSVNVDGVDNPMMFSSGRAAERAGRDLALKLARQDQSVHLELRLRGGAVAARFIVLPPTEHDDRPLMVETPALRKWSGERGVDAGRQDGDLALARSRSP
jgi:hypothetical protein